MNLNNKILLILILLTLIFSTSTFALTFEMSFSQTTINASSNEINFYLSGTDINKVCFSKTSSCTNYTDFASSINLHSYNSSLWSSDKNNAIYVFAKDADGNVIDYALDWVVNDNNAPILKTKYPSNSSYNTGDFLAELVFYDSWSAILKPTIKLDGNTINNSDVAWNSSTFTATFNLTGITEGTHTISTDVNDELGNERTSSYDFIVDYTAPKNGSISVSSGWTNLDKPTFTIKTTHTGSSIKFALGCTTSNLTNWITYTTSTGNSASMSYSDFNINSAANGCTKTDWNKTIYAKFKDEVGNEDGNVYKTFVLYDNVKPNKPRNLTGDAGNKEVDLEWDAPSSADNNSGNKEYYIYKNDSKIDSTSDTSITIDGLTNGTTYDFKVTTVDNAGNESEFSNEISLKPSATTSRITVTRNNEDVQYVKNGDNLLVKCTFSDSISGTKIRYTFYSPETDNFTLTSSSSNVSSLSENFAFTSDRAKHTEVAFWCEGSNVSSSSKYYVTVDNNAPIIEWVDNNNQFTGITKVILNVKDNRYIDKVQIDLAGNRLTATQNINSNQYAYSVDINTLAIENGDYNIKATAIDKAANITEITKIIHIENLGSTKQKAIKTIEMAKEKQIIANDQVRYYSTEGLELNDSLKTKKVQADALLTSAIVELDKNADLALEKSTTSLKLFEEFITQSKVETTQTKTYTIDTNNLIENLKNNGLSEEAAKKQEEIVLNTNIERTLSVIKTGDENTRQVIIQITFTNDTNEDFVRIIEIIPKELMKSAKKLVSDVNFRVIQDDPVVEFIVSAPKGGKVSFSYGTGEIAKEEADKIVNEEVIQKFAVPPIIAENNTSTEELLAGNGNFMSIIIAILVLVIIVVILGILVVAIFFSKFIGTNHGFGEQKSIVEHLAPKKEEPEKKSWKAK